MDLAIAVAYVLAVYVGIPLWAFGAWSERQERRDPVARTRRRGLERIRRELERRRRGLIDTDDERETYARRGDQ